MPLSSNSLLSSIRQAGFFISMFAATLVTLAVLAGLTNQGAAFRLPFSENEVPSEAHFTGDEISQVQAPSLAELALGKVLQDGAPVFGMYANNQSDTTNWMKAYDDRTLVVHMNLPGAHDADTWNYSLATQQYLDHVTDLVQDFEVNPAAYRCQDKSMRAMLDAGIRVFDLRYAYDVTNSTLVFWHGPGLVSETATVDDVMYGFYQWLEDHPSEALFLSFQYEGSTTQYAADDAGVQMALYQTLTTPAARKYFLQTKGSLGTLGQARGKITLLRRFDLNLLPASYTTALPGLHFSPNDWTDNGPNITLVYNTTSGATAYIEDYYQPLTPEGSSAAENIQWKVNATEAHLRMAASTHPDSLFWSFASSTNIGNDPPDTPRIQALGNGSLTPAGGVNQHLESFLKSMKGKRLGWLMFDFFEQPADLVPLYLSLLPPEQAPRYDA